MENDIHNTNISWHRPVCAKCQQEMHPEQNGVGVIDIASFGPYKIWDADLWKCPKCGVEIIVGFGKMAIAEHYQNNFQKVIDGYEKTIECHF